MKLHNYQKRAIEFMELHHKCVLSVGMGLGKTTSVLHYIDRLRPKSAIIIAPKRVAESVWKQEAEKWGLTWIADKMTIAKGTATKRHEALVDTQHPYKIVSRDNLADLFGKNEHLFGCYEFEMVVLDELTSFKSITAKRTRQAAALTRLAKYAIGLTGTFLANGAVDIYAQMCAAGMGNLDKFYSWRATNFIDVMAGSGMKWSKWKLQKPLEDVLKPWRNNIFTLDSKDYLDIPEVTFINHEIELSSDERKRYDEMNAFLGCDIGGVEVSVEEAAKFVKMQTMCDGFVYVGSNDAVCSQWNGDNVARSERSSKLEEVAELCRRCVGEGENVLLFYAFKAEREWLRELMAGDGFDVAEVRDKGVLERWMRGEFSGVMMAHPASAGHGLNLQGGGRVLVWSTLTYNYEHYAQANARLARQGQRGNVQIHIFTAAGTIEDEKRKALAEKDKMQNVFLALTKELGMVVDG